MMGLHSFEYVQSARSLVILKPKMIFLLTVDSLLPMQLSAHKPGQRGIGSVSACFLCWVLTQYQVSHLNWILRNTGFFHPFVMWPDTPRPDTCKCHSQSQCTDPWRMCCQLGVHNSHVFAIPNSWRSVISPAGFGFPPYMSACPIISSRLTRVPWNLEPPLHFLPSSPAPPQPIYTLLKGSFGIKAILHTCLCIQLHKLPLFTVQNLISWCACPFRNYSVQPHN